MPRVAPRTALTALLCSLALLAACTAAPPAAEDLDARVARLVDEALATRAAQTAAAPPTIAPTPMPAHTPAPAPSAAATQAPAPVTQAPNTSLQVLYERLAPSIAFVETPLGTGSGLLLEGGYVVTNAHVVWPFRAARLAFPDGAEVPAAPVRGWDLMVDLAVLGPLEVDAPPLTLADGEELPVTSEMYLLGYPGEVERFPQPAISRGILSRVRTWETLELTFYQSDAAIAGGQSGGALVAADGRVIGLSGFAFADAYALVASAADIAPRIERLIAGEDTAGLGERLFAMEPGSARQTVDLENLWDVRAFLVYAQAGDTVECEVAGAGDGLVALLDLYGEPLFMADDGYTGVESGSARVSVSAPYIVVVAQSTEGAARYRLRSSHPLTPLQDVDDGRPLVPGETLTGSIDHPWDSDYYLIDLVKGERVEITVDSVMLDPYLTMDFEGAAEEEVAFDDDSGGGLFGLNARLTYTAPHSGRFLLVVEDAERVETGGYLLTVRTAPPDGEG